MFRAFGNTIERALDAMCETVLKFPIGTVPFPFLRLVEDLVHEVQVADTSVAAKAAFIVSRLLKAHPRIIRRFEPLALANPLMNIIESEGPYYVESAELASILVHSEAGVVFLHKGLVKSLAKLLTSTGGDTAVAVGISGIFMCSCYDVFHEQICAAVTTDFFAELACSNDEMNYTRDRACGVLHALVRTHFEDVRAAVVKANLLHCDTLTSFISRNDLSTAIVRKILSEIQLLADEDCTRTIRDSHLLYFGPTCQQFSPYIDKVVRSIKTMPTVANEILQSMSNQFPEPFLDAVSALPLEHLNDDALYEARSLARRVVNNCLEDALHTQEIAHIRKLLVQAGRLHLFRTPDHPMAQHIPRAVAWLKLYEHCEFLGIADVSEPPELICPVSLCLFKNPVVASDGHTYEKQSLLKLFEIHGTGTRSPVTRELLDPNYVLPNRAVRSMVDSFRERDLLIGKAAFAKANETDGTGREAKRQKIA